jgi:purine-nucleoside phosphorylase
MSNDNNSAKPGKQPRPELAAKILKKVCPTPPRLAFVLGSGFQAVAARVEVDEEISYSDLPGFPVPKVAGHAGKLRIGRLGGTPVAMLAGRVHYYEGYPMERVTFAIRVLGAWGIRDLVLTNAAGGIHRSLQPGDFMVLNDHINLMGTNPLRGCGTTASPGFIDLSQAYDRGLGKLLQRAGKAAGLKLRSGVYLAVSGPSYETPAEIRAFAALGADAVGMSTVPETIVARQCGLRVAGLSCITNLAAGRGSTDLSHQEVLAVGAAAGEKAGDLLEAFARLYGSETQV